MSQPLPNCPRCRGTGKLYGWPDDRSCQAYFERVGEEHPLKGRNYTTPCPICFTGDWVKWVRRTCFLFLFLGLLDLGMNQGEMIGAAITLLKGGA